ncbi:hypothetical protein BH09PSE2_BH09PSE2_08330 [soil metagenome]
MAPAPRPEAGPQPPGRWWLSAQGRVYGPYDAIQLAGFAGEGRLAAQSLLARTPAGPFAAAVDQPELHALFGAPAPADAADVEPVVETAVRSLLVLASAREMRPEEFEALLADFGPVVRVRGSLWLCRAPMPAAALRNALTRRLGTQDFLFVVGAELADAAWFNLDGDADRNLRRLWASGGG